MAAAPAGCDDGGTRARAFDPAGGKSDDADAEGEDVPLNPCEEQRLLQFANSSRTDAYAFEAAGLDADAARLILERRRGVDARDGTRDDAMFRTALELEELVGEDATALLDDAADEALGWECTSPAFADDTLRIVAANLTSGRYQSYDEGHGSRILEALQPDVVLLQEVRYADGSKDAMYSWIREMLGDEYTFVYGATSLPNGIASRYPIREWGEWIDAAAPDRNFVWARIDIPGDADLWAVSVHLLTKSAPVRAGEAKVLLEQLERIPAGDFVTVGGDFNTKFHDEDALEILGEAITTDGPYPADADGNTMTNANRRYPYDFVFVDPELARHAAVTRQGTSTFPLGLVVDTRTYDPIGDLAPAQASDSGAEQMQHMAVVRDFALP